MKVENKPDPVECCGELYPETISEFRAIQQRQIALFSSKQLDYGPNNIMMSGDTQLSQFALLVRMNDKLQRMFHLHKTKKAPLNESIVDCYQDVSIYGIIAQIVASDKWGK